MEFNLSVLATNIKNGIATLLYKVGLSANFLTFLGLFFAAVSGVLIYQGEFFWAGAMLLLAGGFDLMDGAVARVSNKASSFGGVLDSALDRYGDFFVLAGLVLYYSISGDLLYLLLSLSALAGSFEISYVRARAECVVPKCKVGFWERGERLVYLSLGLLLGNPETVLWVLAIGTHLTALYRLTYAGQIIKKGAGSQSKSTWIRDLFFHPGGRESRLYFLKCALWLLLVLLVHPPI